jgi:hypothetical protein
VIFNLLCYKPYGFLQTKSTGTTSAVYDIKSCIITAEDAKVAKKIL